MQKPEVLAISIFIVRSKQVQRFRGSRFHSRSWTAFGMRIYEKSVSFIRTNPKFGAKVAIIWENEDFGSLMPSLSLTLNVEL
jgi:hypothetical protein